MVLSIVIRLSLIKDNNLYQVEAIVEQHCYIGLLLIKPLSRKEFPTMIHGVLNYRSRTLESMVEDQ